MELIPRIDRGASCNSVCCHLMGSLKVNFYGMYLLHLRFSVLSLLLPALNALANTTSATTATITASTNASACVA